MKFTKSFLAVAIAGIAAAPMMASATTTLSGVVEIKLSGDDSGDPGPFRSTETGDAGFFANDVLMGVSAEQALNTGLTGYGSLRYDLNTISGGEFDDADSVFVGIKGGFGDLRFGEVPNPGEYGQVNDILTDMGTTINAGVSYVGSFGGATVGVAYSPAINQDVIGVGAKFAWNGLALGVGLQDARNVNDDAIAAVEADPAAGILAQDAVLATENQTDNISASVGFSAAGASISLGYVVLGEAFTNANGTVDDETAIVAQVGYSIAGVSLGLTYDAQTESEDNQLRLDAGYDLGGGTRLSSRVNVFTDGAAGGPDDLTDWRIMLGKTF